MNPTQNKKNANISNSSQTTKKFCIVEKISFVAIYIVGNEPPKWKYSLHDIFSLQFKWCLEDTRVKDMFIPKGTCVFVNKHWLHWDQDLWGPEDIKEFVPER